MKNALLGFMAAALIVLPSLSQALVRELAACETADGEYRISVVDNQGIGPVRKSHITAQITHSDGSLVGTYPVELFKGAQSISFGRAHYQDTATQGHLFLLSGPSTNFRHYSIRAQSDDAVISDDGLKCSVFAGAVLH